MPTTILSPLICWLLLAAVAGCRTNSPRLALERSWTRPARIQATDGVEICADLQFGKSRSRQPLVLELAVLDAQGRPLPSAMPELANARGELVVRRELVSHAHESAAHDLCTFVPLEAFPEPGARRGVQLTVRDAAGKVLLSKTAELAPARAPDTGAEAPR